MSSDRERAWRPRIYRAWSTRDGRFFWTFTRPQANSWTGATLSSARLLERQAAQFCATLNRRAT